MENNEEKGMKFDKDKLRHDLVLPEWVEALADVLTFGAKKYAPGNWAFVEDAEDRYYAAAMRHALDYRKGEKIDPESGKSHLHHWLTNVAFLIYFENKKIDNINKKIQNIEITPKKQEEPKEEEIDLDDLPF